MNKGVNKNIKAESHPSHYMMHKYWGRKPHNVVREYITSYTKEGDIVLDPFMGSGVVVIEALKVNRKAVGIDLNPMACFIAQNTIASWDEENFEQKFKDIYGSLFNRFSYLYETLCPICSAKVHFENSIWEDQELVRIRGVCESCGKFVKYADTEDKNKFESARATFKKLDKQGRLDYPRDEVMKYVKRNGKTHLYMLFSERALIILGTLIKEIWAIKDKNTRNLMLMCFTSMLPNVSKMIPGDKRKGNGRSGWVISKLWAPRIHTEKNIFKSFKERFIKINKGKRELNGTVNYKEAKIFNSTAENLSYIKTSSIDYIFTDPPYGDSIAYFALSMFWNSWLKYKVDYEGEIIYDPYRNKRHGDYAQRMEKVFAELYRVLKNKGHLSFTFHNRNLKIWKAVIDAVRKAGFHLENIIYQEQAVASGTQGINWKNTLRGDFVYNFIKEKRRRPNDVNSPFNAEDYIVKNVSYWIRKSKDGLSADSLYEKLIPLIVEKNAYSDTDGNIIRVENILRNNFSYGPVGKKPFISYVWKEKTDK